MQENNHKPLSRIEIFVGALGFAIFVAVCLMTGLYVTHVLANEQIIVTGILVSAISFFVALLVRPVSKLGFWLLTNGPFSSGRKGD